MFNYWFNDFHFKRYNHFICVCVFFLQIYAADESVEIVKAVTPDKKERNEPEKEMDQVALESQDQESPPAILIPHAPPPLPPGQYHFLVEISTNYILYSNNI